MCGWDSAIRIGTHYLKELKNSRMFGLMASMSRA